MPTIAIAPMDEALTFARTTDRRTIGVLSYEEGNVEGIPIEDDKDAIDFLNLYGYQGARALLEASKERVVVDAKFLGVPVDLSDRHIAAGTNYRDHAEEAAVDGGPFLFPKYVTPTGPRAPIPAGDALLDYEVELCLVPMRDIPAGEKATGGLVLCNDVTDRATLLREIDPENPQSGDGFTSGKSADGYLPVGDLFVVPRDLETFIKSLSLQLSVDGAERQRTKATLWIWDFDRILEEARTKKNVGWRYWGGVATLPLNDDGALPARTMIMGGTPGGTVFKGIYPSAYVRGIYAWITSGFADDIPHHVIEAQISAARESGDYLQTGSIVTIDVDKMGALANRIE